MAEENQPIPDGTTAVNQDLVAWIKAHGLDVSIEALTRAVKGGQHTLVLDVDSGNVFVALLVSKDVPLPGMEIPSDTPAGMRMPFAFAQLLTLQQADLVHAQGAAGRLKLFQAAIVPVKPDANSAAN